MATSGTLQLNPNTYTTDGAPNRADINWSATWNSSTLQWSVSWNAVAAGNTNSYWVTIFSGTVTFTDANGNVLDTKSMAAQVPKARGGDQLLSGSFVVGVDSLGNQTLNISGRFQIEYNGSGSDNAGTSKGSGSYALDQMAMASTFTVTSSTVGASGGASTVNISRRSPSYTHSVTWTFGSYTHTETGVGTSVTYTIPASWLNAIPSKPNGVGTVTVQTYNGSTPIGSAATAQFSVTAAVYPSIGSFTSAPRGAAYTAQITNYTTTYVSGYSTALLTASSVAGAYGSSIKRYDFYQSGALIAQASSSASSYSYETVNPVSGSEIQFTVVVTDTRDRQTSANVSISLRPYAVPSYTETTVYRCNQSGTATNDGTYVFIRASAYATPTENSITSLSFAVKPTSSSTYGSEIALTNGTYKISSGYANTSSYDIRIKATDKLGQSSYRYFTIPTAEYTMDFKVGGKGVAFGKVAETDNLVDSAWSIKTSGNIQALGSGTFGTSSESATQVQLINNTGSLFMHRNGANRGIYDNAIGWIIHTENGATVESSVPFQQGNWVHGLNANQYQDTSTTVSITQALTWTDCNMYLYTPVSGIYMFYATSVYDTAEPCGICVYSYTNGYLTNFLSVTDRASNALGIGTTGTLVSSGTAYLNASVPVGVKVRYYSTGNNPVYLSLILL